MTMRADEIAGALGELDTAKGSVRNPSPPSNAELVVQIEHFQMGRSQNATSKLSGLLYAVADLKVLVTNTTAAPEGSSLGLFFGGLDSKQNNGSLAQTNLESLRRFLAAVLGVDPNSSPPPVPVTPDNPTPKQGWGGIAGFFAAHPEALAGHKIRLVTGTAKAGKPVYPDQIQFFKAA